MAATPTIPAGGAVPATGKAVAAAGAGASAAVAAPTGAAAPGAVRAANTAMVPVGVSPAEDFTPDIGGEEQIFSPAVLQLPVELDVMVPVRGFRVRSLLALEPGQVIESQWGHGDDVPLTAGAVGLAWTEFEVIDSQLAVRITRLT